MALNPIPLKCVKAVDNALALNSERIFGVYDGGREISYTPFYSQNVNNGNIHVDFNPPDQNTAIFPQFYTKALYDLQFLGTGPGSTDPLLTPGVYSGVRAFPTLATTGTIDIKLNGQSITSNVNEYMHTLLRCGIDISQFDNEFSCTASMLDQFQEYEDGANTNLNPLANYGDNVVQQSRGAFLNPATGGPNYITNSHTAAHVQFTSVEPVLVSPFYHSKASFFGKTFNGTWTFTQLNRVWCQATLPSAGVISSIVTNIVSFTVLMRFLTPKELSHISSIQVYGYHEILPLLTTNNNALASGASTSLSMNSVNLDAVPKRLLICVRQQDSTLLNNPLTNFLQSDSFARIDQITINWANSQGKLSSADLTDLYHIYRNNGGKDSFVKWSKFVGSILPIDLGRDIGLDSLSAPGKMANPQLSMTVNYTNLSSRSKIFSLCVFVIYEGTVSNLNGNVTKNIAVLNSQNVLDTNKMMPEYIEHNENRNMYGGGLWDDVKKGFSKVRDYVKKHKLASRALKLIPHPVAQTGSILAKHYGYGSGLMSQPQYYVDEEYSGGRRKLKKKK